MLISSISSKGQATIPAEIRKQLNLLPGDKLTFSIEDNHIIINKLTSFDHSYHQALSTTLSEWNSPEDDEAYGDL